MNKKNTIAICIVTFVFILSLYFYINRPLYILKRQPSPDKSITIGQLLDSYNGFSKINWESTTDERGRVSILFTGDLEKNELNGAKIYASKILKVATELYEQSIPLELSHAPGMKFTNLRLVEIKDKSRKFYNMTAKANHSLPRLTSCSLSVVFDINSDKSGYTIRKIELRDLFIGGKDFNFNVLDKDKTIDALAKNKPLDFLIVNSLQSDDAPEFPYGDD